ncbi:MAG: twin-arginine translocase TatA/TatE family subunit [Collinsella sp.]|nr:twin-arginine translocase TatA/TatE family subunit [Collinsella sp.]
MAGPPSVLAEVHVFGIGSTELVIILVFGFLLFGPDKLPQMGRTIGRALRQFRETQEKMTSMVQSEVIDPMAAAVQEPAKKPKAAPAAADDDDDADLPSAAAAPKQKETFAERRARLAAEKAEREAVAAADASAGAADAPAAPSAPAPDAPAAEEPAPEAAEPAPRTTADLYARRPRKRPAAPVEPAASEADPRPADATTPEGGER